MSYLTDRTRLWAKRAAVNYLGRYSASESKLHSTIMQKAQRKYEGIEEQEAEELAKVAVSFCLENGFLNDAAYTESQIAAGMRRGASKRKLAAKLSEQGVEEDFLRTALEEVDDLTSALAYAKRRRIGPWRKTELDQKLKQRELASFARQGFSVSIGFKVMEMTIMEAEERLSETKSASMWRHD